MYLLYYNEKIDLDLFIYVTTAFGQKLKVVEMNSSLFF